MNGQFIFNDDNYLLGKSDENNNEFDVTLKKFLFHQMFKSWNS